MLMGIGWNLPKERALFSRIFWPLFLRLFKFGPSFESFTPPLVPQSPVMGQQGTFGKATHVFAVLTW